MRLVVVGVSHKTAPLELRDRLALGDEEAARFARRLLEHDSVAEALALSTCNRAELYLFADDTLAAEQLALAELAGLADTTVADLRPSVYSFSGDAAIAHLFRVSASLDSMVVGEAQILAQIKDAYQNACGSGCTSIVFNKLFRHALEVGKRVRSETSIGERPVSVSSAAVELARQVLGKLDDRTVLVIGAGETSELTARHLRAHGASRILVANRTLAAAEQLAAQCGGAPVAFDALDEHLREADIVISSTSSPGYVLDRARVAAALRRRRRGPVFMIDIAVPRDLDPEIEHVNDVFLYDIDDLKGVVERNRAEREREAEHAERIVAEELAKMDEWLAGLEVVPTIAMLRSAVDGIRESELQRLGARLDDLTPHQREQVELLTTSIVNKILHLPTVRMKELAGERDSYVYVDALRQLFGLDGVDRAASGAGAAAAAPPPAAAPDAAAATTAGEAPVPAVETPGADASAEGCDPCSLGDEVPDVTRPTRKAG